MTIKPPDLLNRIPSVSELLDKPPIRALAERWNQSTVASGVKSFIDELRSDFQRRAANANLSIRELAERAARYVISWQQHSLGVAVNATGRIWDPSFASSPLAEAAVERAFVTGREFALAQNADERNVAQVDPLLCSLTGAPAAAVVHSYAGAVWLAIAALAARREVLVARAEVGGVGELPKLAAAANVALAEVGTTNSALVAEYEAAASERTAAILKLSPDTYCVTGQTSFADLDELIALARDRELLSIDALGAAPLLDPPHAVSWPRRSARASVAAGVDVTILRGDGLVGGPPCGILLGTKDAITRLTNNPLFAAWRLDPLRSAALMATLECYRNTTGGIETIPVWQFLTVSLDNLRNRAQRIAPQLGQAEGIESATAIETRSPLATVVPNGTPSYGIALSPAGGDLDALGKRLRYARFPILGRIENDRMMLDLRTVLPRQDTVLIDAISGTTAADTTE